MPKGIAVYGQEFRAIRDQLFFTQPDLATRLGISISGVQRIESRFIARIAAATFRKLADLAGATPEGLAARLCPPPGELAKFDADSDAAEGEPGVEAASVKPLAEIPTFDLSLAAGPWSDVLDVPSVCDPGSIAQGLFRVRLAGDSMMPDYRGGMIVEFECLKSEVDNIQVGRDYYVRRDDGAATFKRVESMTDDLLTLRALNKKKFPKPFTVERSRITKMAIARGEFRAFE